jgi:hypothetical protein
VILFILLIDLQQTYSGFNIKVEPLQIDQANLNTKRMLDLMAVGQDQGPVSLYMHTVQRILREMRILQQNTGSQFDYWDFKEKILDSGLLLGQLEPLKQRLDTLESFMPPQQAAKSKQANKKKAKFQGAGSDWTPKVKYWHRIKAPSYLECLMRNLGVTIDNC